MLSCRIHGRSQTSRHRGCLSDFGGYDLIYLTLKPPPGIELLLNSTRKNIENPQSLDLSFTDFLGDVCVGSLSTMRFIILFELVFVKGDFLKDSAMG